MSSAVSNTQDPKVLATYSKRLTQDEAISRANERRLIILSNLQLDARLMRTDSWKEEIEVYPAWSGTMGACGKPGASFKESNRKDSGAYVVYTDPETKITYRFPVPKEFRNAKDAILVIEHGFNADGKPTFEIQETGKDQREIYIPDQRTIQLVQGLPREDGWYLTESNFGIPVGEQINSDNPDARHFYALAGMGSIGLAARGWWNLELYYRRAVGLCNRPSYRAGVLGFDTLQQLATEAEGALVKIGHAIQEETLKPIRRLIEATKHQ